MTNNLEKRYSFSPDNKEFRAQIVSNSDNSDSRHIKGYGIVFNQRSKIITEYDYKSNEWRSFYEVISPNAIDNILNNGFDVVMDINHDFNEILARISSSTLTLSKDEKGVLYEFDSPNTSRGDDALEMVKRGDYYESSFMFTVKEDEWAKDETTGLWIRTILQLENLYDMAICTYRGAYDNTSITANGEPRVYEYKKEDVEVAARKLNELSDIQVSEAHTSDEEIKRKKYNEDFITRIYIKRNWERKKLNSK